MEIAILVGILIVVWYYGHSLKAASESDSRIKASLPQEFFDLKNSLSKLNTSVTQVAKNIEGLEHHLSAIGRAVDSAEVEWKHFNKHKIDAMLNKLDSLGAFSVDLSSIHDTLQSIESAVDAISAHPAFTWSEDDK